MQAVGSGPNQTDILFPELAQANLLAPNKHKKKRGLTRLKISLPRFCQIKRLRKGFSIRNIFIG